MGASLTTAAEGAAPPFRGFDVDPTEPPEELVWDGAGFSPAPTPMRLNRRRGRDDPPQPADVADAADGLTPQAGRASPSGGDVAAGAPLAAAPPPAAGRVVDATADRDKAGAARSLGWWWVVLVPLAVFSGCLLGPAVSAFTTLLIWAALRWYVPPRAG